MHATPSDAPVRLFCGYHEEDCAFHKALSKHLTPMVHAKIIEILDGGHVPAGAEVTSTIEGHLSRAEVIVLLVSANFTGDKNKLWWKIMDLAVNAAHLVPVRVRQVGLEDTPLKQRQLLPRDTPRGMDALPPAEQDEEWTKIAGEIREIVDEIRRTRAAEADERAAAPVDSATVLRDVQAQKKNAYDLVDRGRGTDALGELRVALEKLETLSSSSGEDASLKKERAHLHNRIGQCEYAQGRFEAAREAFDLAFEIRIGLRGEGDDKEVRHDIATSHFWRAHLGFIRGDLPLARDEQRAGMSVCEALLADDANDLTAARALVVLETDLGTTLWELGDLAGAEEHLRESLKRVRELAQRHPENRQLQRDVSVGLFRLADFLVARGEVEPAAQLCEESIGVCRALSEWDPSNVQWRRHLATARISMGDVRLFQSDMALARGDYEFAVGTMGALAAQEQENLLGQRQYAISERKLGELAYKNRSFRESLEAYKRAAAAMEPASSHSERWRRELAEIRNALKRAQEAVG